MDFENDYDMIDRHGLWQMIRVYGVGWKLLKLVKSLYVHSREGVEVSEGFLVIVGLIQSCVLSPWLLNVYKDDVVLELNAPILGRGQELLCDNGVKFEISQLLFEDVEDDAALYSLAQKKGCVDL